MKTLKNYLIEGGREDLIPLMEEWNPTSEISSPFINEVFRQHSEISSEEMLARAGYRWLTLKYPPATKEVQESSQAVATILKAYHLPKWAIIVWAVLVLLILGVIAARSEPKPFVRELVVEPGLLYQIGGGPFVQVQNAGTQIKLWAAGIARLNCSTNMTCTYNAGTGAVDMTASSTAGTAWSSLTAPTTNLSLSHSAWTTTFTWNATTGASNLFTFTDTLNNTGTGALLRAFTASGSAATPFQADANGNGVKVDTAGQLGIVGTGNINSTKINGVSITGTPANGQIPIASSGTAAAWGDPIVSGPTAVGSAPTTNPLYVAGLDGTNIRFFRFFDLDSGAGTDYNLGISLRKAASGGSVELGTATDPVRTDPTGTTTQPISAASLPLPAGAATETTLASRLADATFTGRINTQGQKTMAGSTPVVIASDQLIACDSSVVISVSTAVTTQLVALTSGQTIYVCSFSFMSAGTTNVTFEYGTGTLCSTGLTTLTGAYNTTAQTGVSQGSGLGTIFRTAASNALCIVNSAAVQVSGIVSFTKF